MANLCNQTREQFEADMLAYERDRESAASTTESCHRCHVIAELDLCPFCSQPYCVVCQEQHECVAEILRRGL